MGSSRCEVAQSRYRILGVAEVAVTIIFRVIVGAICDILGPRRGLAFLLFLACPGILGMMSAAEQEWMAGSEGEAALAAIPIPIEQRRVLQRYIPVIQFEVAGPTLFWKSPVVMFWSYKGTDQFESLR